jgi:acyl-CoA reductase-like NAD-dependent aldehyde dehydrogenase
LAGNSEVQQVLAKPRRAHAEWRNLRVPERAALLARAVDAFVGKKAETAAEITWQMGRPIRYTPSEVGGFEERAAHRERSGRLRQLHGLGHRRPYIVQQAAAQGFLQTGLEFGGKDPACRSRPRGRELGRGRLLQQWPVLLRDRAHLCP